MLRSPGVPQPLSPFLSLCEGDLLGGRYRIESLLSSRAAVVQFDATDLTRGTRVAAHVLVSQAGSVGDPAQDSARAAFIAGTQRAKALTSPYVAQVLEAGVTFEGHPWLVREHIASGTIDAHIRQHGALRTSEAVDIALAVCDVIAEAHALGMIHGSLGAHSVHAAWSASGLVDMKVTGIGTARAEAELSLGSTGKVDCILRAPEQLRDGSAIDGRADVWAIGVLLHTMLAGSAPFSADTPSGASLSVILDDPPRLEGVSYELGEIVLRALSKDPAARPATVLELARSIVCFASHPDIARDRIANRVPPAAGVAASESDPTLIMHRSKFAPPAMPVAARVATVPDAAPSSPIPPSVRDIRHDRPRSFFDASSLSACRIGAPPMRRRDRRDMPTVITKKPGTGDFPRLRALRFLGIVTAAACVSLLVLIATEGSRIETGGRASAAPLHEVTASAPPEASPLPTPAASSAPRPEKRSPLSFLERLRSSKHSK